jgi:hypothetical protein
VSPVPTATLSSPLPSTDDITDAGAGRELLQGRGGGYHGHAGASGRPVRSFDTVAQHKQPKTPTPATRKSYERTMPTGRKLQQKGGPRPLDRVAAHKQP